MVTSLSHRKTCVKLYEEDITILFIYVAYETDGIGHFRCDRILFRVVSSLDGSERGLL